MKNYLNLSTIVFQIFSLTLVLLGPVLLFSGSSCNAIKTRDSKVVAYELNEKKFHELEDKKNAKFLVDAAEIHLKQIHLAQLAQQEGKQIDVKELGRMMEKSNSNSFGRLAELAGNKSVSIPISTTRQGLETVEFLNQRSGLSFDKEYCDIMVVNQKQAIKVFEEISEQSHDLDIQVWALSTLVDLRKHLQHARTCQKKCASM